MFVWCAILFLLGISAFLDSLFNYGEIFRQINSVLFMLVSLGLLIRTTLKTRAQVFERQVARIAELERKLDAMDSRQNMDDAEKPAEEPAPVS